MGSIRDLVSKTEEIEDAPIPRDERECDICKYRNDKTTYEHFCSQGDCRLNYDER